MSLIDQHLFTSRTQEVIADIQPVRISYGQNLEAALVKALRASRFKVHTERELQASGFSTSGISPDLYVEADNRAFEVKAQFNHDGRTITRFMTTRIKTERELSRNFGVPVAAYVVGILQATNYDVYLSLHKRIPLEYCLSGRDFCVRYGLDYDSILAEAYQPLATRIEAINTSVQ